MKKDNLFKGVIHIHSKYSYDGTLSLEGITRLCKKKGYAFVVLTEHADDFNDDKMDILVNECRKISDNTFILIPGLEFNCGGMHILAIGIERFFLESYLGKLIDKIHENRGLAILAHVVFYDNIPYEKLKDLDGIEVWDPKYEGRFSPSLKSLDILKKFRKQKKEILAFGGSDLHEKYEIGKISTFIHTTELNQKGILKALRDGRFHTSNGLINFDSQKDPTIYKLFILYLIRFPYGIGKALRRVISSTLKKIGTKPPKTLSKTLRQVF